MLKLNGVIKDFKVKSNEIVVNLSIPTGKIDIAEVSDLYTYSRENLAVLFMRRPQYEQWDKDGQLDFEVVCPDCQGWDCVIGYRLAVCNTCGKEFQIQERINPEEKKLLKEDEQAELLFGDALNDPPEDSIEEPPPEESPEDMAINEILPVGVKEIAEKIKASGKKVIPFGVAVTQEV